MQIQLSNDTFNVDDGTYRATIKSIQGYNDNTKALVKLELESGETLIKSYNTSELGEHPWSAVFKALNTTESDDLVGRTIEIEVKNHTSSRTGVVFSNVKKIRLLEE